MIAGPGGFTHAPIFKLLWVLVLAESIGVMITNSADLFWFDPIHTLTNPTDLLWRPITSLLFTRHPLELFSVLILLYQWRMFERQLGSSKTSILICLSFVSYILLLVATLVHPSSPKWLSDLLSAPVYGPFWLISSFLVLYIKDVPSSLHFRLFGIPLSNKWLIYGLVFQCILAGLPFSIIGTISGLISGLLFHSPSLGIRDYHPPNWLTSTFAAVFLPLLEPSSIRNANAQQQQQQQGRIPGIGRNLGGNIAAAAEIIHGGNDFGNDIYSASDNQQQQQQEQQQEEEDHSQISTQASNQTEDISNAIASSLLSNVEPSQEAINTLISMGFDERRAREALSKCGGTNIQAATSLLLDGNR